MVTQILYQITCHNSLNTICILTMTTMVPELLDHLCITQEYDTILGDIGY